MKIYVLFCINFLDYGVPFFTSSTDEEQAYHNVIEYLNRYKESPLFMLTTEEEDDSKKPLLEVYKEYLSNFEDKEWFSLERRVITLTGVAQNSEVKDVFALNTALWDAEES